MLLSQFHHRCLAVNHGCSLSICTKEDNVQLPGSCVQRVYRGPQSIRDFQLNTGTVFVAIECL
jgi:hypothetical protein